MPPAPRHLHAGPAPAATLERVSPPAPYRWPPPLRPGDLVAAIAPAGPPDPARVKRGVGLLRSWGLEVRLGAAVWQGDVTGFLAAPDEARAADLTAAFADPAVAAVLCLRGGYGSQRLLDRLDLDDIPPKAFVGFSDVTALHVALGQRARLVTFHGPSLQWDERRLPPASAASLQAALFGGPELRLTGEPLHPGQATAPLVGGNLTLLSTLCGTPDQLEAHGRVLLLEDVAEAPYRIDRALTHLARAGVLGGVVGLAFGGFAGCGTGDESAALRSLAADLATALGVPAVYGLPLGHGRGQRTVPLGATVSLDGAAGTLTVQPPR
jgi:muramoyltetrapeptide carboxypeptidase